ncbi:hypothetical protein [Chryseobacterium carnipullorum]|uniref:hypothetical protein n=1 Tax=Chryseobacterium carnipullorum TaxID=1124835 RepID=UPI000E89D8AA|nr:hypothetical protein [Chryseobacterium carnipullorum]HBV14979.1 hypothetical protein [Chryseobacterium carnipullorum]
MENNDKRIGNKFFTLFDLKTEGIISFVSGGKANILFDIKKISRRAGNIHQKIAESFIKSAKSGTLTVLKNNNLNTSKDGVYKLSYEHLRALYNEMVRINEENGAVFPEYLTFSFVEIERDKFEYLDLSTEINEDNKTLYIALSFQDKDKKTIDNHNYLLINAVAGTNILDAKINDIDLLKYQNDYVEKYLFDGKKDMVLNKYFSYDNGKEKLGNTRSSSYYIRDIEDLLNSHMGYYMYNVYLSEITDVLQLLMIYPDIEVIPEVYKRHFKNRRKQLTLILRPANNDGEPVDDYNDMGTLYP